MENMRPLSGARIWLSGSVPPGATAEQKASVLKFISGIAARVFRAGGHIIHGHHPSFTPTLIHEAREYIQGGGRRDCLTLGVSRFFIKDEDPEQIKTAREVCAVYETPEDTGANRRDASLKILRTWISERCDAYIGVGGNWWDGNPEKAGVPIEIGLAMRRGIPCFLLGGLGGAALDFVKAKPELIYSLKNGFSPEINSRIATTHGVENLVGIICRQLEQLPLVHGRVSDGISFRILALDGGGIKGAYTASVLEALEKALNKPIAEHFDLIAGTSTGGILAIGLGMGLTPEEILRFYREKGPEIFPMLKFSNRLLGKLRHLFQAKHSQEILYKALAEAYFSNNNIRTLRESTNRLVIPAYDATSGRCHTFRTPHHPLLIGDADTNAAEVAIATAAAPTYFSAAKVKQLIAKGTYFDGGVWANCPVMAGIVEAVCYLDVPLDRIDILSIGTTEEPFTVKRLAKSGILGWNKTLLDLLMNAQVDSAVNHAKLLIGEPRFLRINTTTPQGEYTLDDTRAIEDLISLGSKCASDTALLSNIKSRFLNGIGALDWTKY